MIVFVDGEELSVNDRIRDWYERMSGGGAFNL